MEGLRYYTRAIERLSCRLQAKSDFDKTALGRLGALAPHIGAATRLRNALAAARAETRAACDALDAADVGVILVDGAGTPAFVSRRADRLLSEKRGLTLRRGSLGAATGAATQNLRRLIASAAGRRFGEGDLRLALPQPPGRRPLIVRAAPLSRASADAAGDARFRVALFLHDPGARDEPEARTIAAAYGLTPREAEVAVALARGADVNAAARALGVSVGTVRTHLKAVFAKTETRRQGDLIRLVLGLRP